MHFEYSIVSIGTEKFGNKGYMCVSQMDEEGYRWICPYPHFVDNIKTFCADKSLRISGSLSIEQIAFIRFQLIPSLAFKNFTMSSFKKIGVIGGGALGVATYYELKRLGAKNIFLMTRRNEYVGFLNSTGINVDTLNMTDYDCLIDCTGDGLTIRNALEKISLFGSVFLIGTPRSNNSIDSLVIHRKNLRLYGGHELNGVTDYERQIAIDILSEWHIENSVNIKKFVKLHLATANNLIKILNHSCIEPINILINEGEKK